MSTRAVPKDPNNVPIIDPNLALVEEKEVVFDGGTTDAIGDHDGALDPLTLFNVTGTVKVRVFAVVTENLAGATATIEIGVAGNTAALIAQSTATDLDVDEIWHDNSPDAALELNTVAAEKVVANGKDIIMTVGTANITDGTIKVLCAWYPISADGRVEAA